ncbi:HAD family hydrolase, partial [Mycobacterium nebraskense]
MTSVARQYDCLLLDLDGTLFRGRRPTEGAVEALAEVKSRAFFVTNNASRSAAEVAAHLTELGFTATADDVATSAQSA